MVCLMKALGRMWTPTNSHSIFVFFSNCVFFDPLLNFFEPPLRCPRKEDKQTSPQGPVALATFLGGGVKEGTSTTAH